MKTPAYFNLIVAGEKLRIRGAGLLRSVVVGVFVGIIALFCTDPVSDAPRSHDKPPMRPALEQAPPAP